MSPAEEPVDVRLTLSREEALAFLEALAHDESTRDRFRRDPAGLLADSGIFVTPSEAIPREAEPPPPEDLERAISALPPEPYWWPWIWICIPWVGRLFMAEEEGGGTESA